MSGTTDLRDTLVAAFNTEDETTEEVDSDVVENEVEEVSEEVETETEEAEEELEAVLPPSSWAKEAQERFQDLPRDLQEVVANREKESQRGLTQKFEEAANIRKKYEKFEDLLTPYRDKWALHGMDEAAAVRQLLSAQELLDRNPIEGISHIAKTYGLSLPQLVAQAQQSGQKIDPQVQKLSQQVGQLQQTIVQREAATQQQLEQSRVKEVEEFISLKDGSGKMLYPHVDSVTEDMIPILGQIKSAKPTASNQEVLKEAYDRACWASPEIRGQLLQQQAQRETAQRVKEESERAKKAKRAASSVTGAPGGAMSNVEAPSDDLRGFLKAQFANS